MARNLNTALCTILHRVVKIKLPHLISISCQLILSEMGNYKEYKQIQCTFKTTLQTAGL